MYYIISVRYHSFFVVDSPKRKLELSYTYKYVRINDTAGYRVEEKHRRHEAEPEGSNCLNITDWTYNYLLLSMDLSSLDNAVTRDQKW